MLVRASQSVSQSVHLSLLATGRRKRTRTHMQRTHNRHAHTTEWLAADAHRQRCEESIMLCVVGFFSFFSVCSFSLFTSLLSKAALSVRLISNMLGLRCLASALLVLSFLALSRSPHFVFTFTFCCCSPRPLFLSLCFWPWLFSKCARSRHAGQAGDSSTNGRGG